ncbi:MAG: hypothetical protein RLZ12_901 [Bacillota bacterium]
MPYKIRVCPRTAAPFVLKSFFDIETALFLISALQQSYTVFHGQKPVLPCGFKELSISPNFFAITNNEQTIIAFRGTSNFQELLYDLNYRPRTLLDYEAGSVHAGFKKGYLKLQPELYTLLSSLKMKEQDFFLTGHSLGAAYASLMAYDIVRQGFIAPPKLFVYLFGAPRLGNSVFAEHYNNLLCQQTYRISNTQDIITILPPRYLPWSQIFWSKINWSNLKKTCKHPSLFWVYVKELINKKPTYTHIGESYLLTINNKHVTLSCIKELETKRLPEPLLQAHMLNQGYFYPLGTLLTREQVNWQKKICSSKGWRSSYCPIFTELPKESAITLRGPDLYYKN